MILLSESATRKPASCKPSTLFADANNKRLVQGEAATALVLSRITTLEDRVLGLEKRLNIPPS